MCDLKLTSFKGRRKRLVEEAWGKFLAVHPGDDSIRLIDPPKPDYGNRLKVAGESWRGDDKHRLRRGCAPQRRLTSQTAMVDGSPLRRLTEDVDVFDVDGDPWFAEEDQPTRRDDFESTPSNPASADDEDCDDPAAITAAMDGELPDVSGWLDGIHGVQPDSYSFDNKPYLLEYCAVCEWEPLPLEWPEPECDFPDSPMPEGQYCHCNGCVVSPKRGPGEQDRYCSTCKSRMDNALDRADRRREGKRSRRPAGESWAPFLDYLTEYKREMRDRARSVPFAPWPFAFTWSKTDLPASEPACRPTRPKYCPPIRTAPGNAA